MAITNPSYETAGAGQGEANGWTASSTSAATALPAITAGDGLVYATEDFNGWVTGQAEYRTAFETGDTTAAPVESFDAWVPGLGEDYRDAFLDSDLSGAPVESFGLWIAGLASYRAAFAPGDLTAAPIEDFDLWVSGQADYRAAFAPGDTTAPSIQAGPGVTTATEDFAACRSDVAVQATTSSSTIAAAGHAFSVNDPVQLLADGTLFAPFQKEITYYVKTAAAGVSVTLSATVGGAAITATADGEGTLIGDETYFWRNPVSAW